MHPVAHRFHPIQQPFAFVRILKVHEFDTDGMAVGFFEGLNNLAQGHLPGCGQPAGKKVAVKILRREFEGFQI